jgi:hypothetical protein
MKLRYTYLLACVLVFIVTTSIMLIIFNQDINHSLTTGGFTVIAFLVVSFIEYILRSD